MGSGALIGLEALAGGLNQLTRGNQRRRDEAREDERFALEKQQVLLQMKRLGLAIEESEFQLAIDKARGTPEEIAQREHEDRLFDIQKRTQDLDLDLAALALDERAVAAQEKQAKASLLSAQRPSRGEGQIGTEILRQLKGQVDGSVKELDQLDDQIDRLREENEKHGDGRFDPEITRLSALRPVIFERLQGDQAALREGQLAASGRVEPPTPEVIPPPVKPPAPGPNPLASSFGIVKDVILGDEPNIEGLLNVGQAAASIKQGLGAAAERGSEIFQQSPLTAPFRNILTEKERSPDTPEIQPPLSNLLNLLFGQR